MYIYIPEIMGDNFQKYLKYKNKYLHMKKQLGGSLAFHPTNNKLLIKKFNVDNGLLSLETKKDYDSKFIFTKEEISGLQFYSEFILPFYEKDKKYIGDTGNIKLLGSGGFGIILRTDDIVIKVLNTRCFYNEPEHEQHHKILQELRNSIIVAKLPYSEHICYTSTIVSSNDIINDEIKKLAIENTQFGKLSVHNITQSQKFDIDALSKSMHNVLSDDDIKKQLIPDTLTFTTAPMGIFGADSDSIYSNFSRSPTFNKITYLFRMTFDSLLGLNVLHSSGYVHCDIKPPNIILGHDGNFKLIDIGSMVKCDSICYPKFGYSPTFVKNSEFEVGNKFKASIFYDLWCLVLPIIKLLGIIVLDNGDWKYEGKILTYDIFFQNYIDMYAKIKDANVKLNITQETSDVTPTFNNLIQLLVQTYHAERNFNNGTQVHVQTSNGKLPAASRIEFENLSISFMKEFMERKGIITTKIFNLQSLQQ
jgi:serine/threonine protein kinase